MTPDYYVRNNKTNSYLCLCSDSGDLVWDFYLPAATPFTKDNALSLSTVLKGLNAEQFSDLTVQQISAKTIETEFNN